VKKNTISLSWGRREIRISGEGATLYVNGVPHDMTMMLETIRGAGARPERISPARWISLLRGRPTVLPGCESPLVMVRVPSGYTVRCLFPAGEKGHSFQAEEMFRFKLSTSVEERIWRFHILHTSSK
jgi:hypothetical protein